MAEQPGALPSAFSPWDTVVRRQFRTEEQRARDCSVDSDHKATENWEVGGQKWKNEALWAVYLAFIFTIIICNYNFEGQIG